LTVQQICAFAAPTERKHRQEGKILIGAVDLEWSFVRNYEWIEWLRS